MNEKQKRFCDEYLITLEATEAARRVGYAEQTAKRAPDWINEKGQEKPSSKFNPELYAYIQERIQARQERTEITQDMVVRELRDIAMAEASDESDSSMKYASKLKALELLGKHLGMFTDKVAISSIDDETRRKVGELLHGRARSGG